MKPTDVLVFDGCSITSKVNASVPTWGGVLPQFAYRLPELPDHKDGCG